MSPEGTLILSILLPAHFMPHSAFIDVKIVLQIREYQCVCLCVCLFACATHLLICVCVYVLFLCFFYYFIFMLYLFSSVEPPVWTTSEHRCSRDISPRWKEQRLFYVHSTFKLYELVIVLWLSFGRLIENRAGHMVCLHVCEAQKDQKKDMKNPFLWCDFYLFIFCPE